MAKIKAVTDKNKPRQAQFVTIGYPRQLLIPDAEAGKCCLI